MINSELESSDRSLLDIGCASASLTQKLLDNGMFCLGVEQRQTVARNTQIDLIKKNNIGIISTEITSKNIRQFPCFDVVLLLTVYQHLIQSPTYPEHGTGFGEEDAEDILQVLASNSNKLFFEIWDSYNPEEKTPKEAICSLFDESRFPFDIGDDPVEFWEQYFHFVLDDNISVKYLGKCSYKGERRNDILFYIDCSTFDGVSERR